MHRVAAGFLAAVAIAASAHARTAEEAKALAERGLAHIREVGREQAFGDFSRPDGGFVDGELYIFCVDQSGVMLAHGGNPKIIGSDISELLPDWKATSSAFERLRLKDGAGWLEFRWPNPTTRRVEPKVAYIELVDDRTICGSGYYTVSPP